MVITKDIKRAITFIRIMLQGHGYSFYSYYFFNKGEYFIIMSLDLQQYHDQIQALRPMDDVFFEVLIQQPGVCEEMLRVLLDCRISGRKHFEHFAFASSSRVPSILCNCYNQICDLRFIQHCFVEFILHFVSLFVY